MILITGASGLVGRRLVAALRARLENPALRLLSSSRAVDPPPDAEAIRGDITDPETAAAATRGAQMVVHLAARTDPSATDIDELRRVNVRATETLFSRSVDAGCTLFVHLSSAGIYGAPRGPDPFKEDADARPITPYQRSKWEAEKALRNIDPNGTTLNILRAPWLYGAGSLRELPLYRKVLQRRWSIELIGGVVVQPTHFDDVAQAIAALLERPGPHGTVFNVGGERRLLYAELDALVAEELGVRRFRIPLPPVLAGPAATAAASLPFRFGRRNPNLPHMSRGRLFSAAVDDSAFRGRYSQVPVRPLRSGIREHIEWARAERLL